MPTPVFELKLLGSFQLTLDDQPVETIESTKGRALLAYLAIERDRIHQRETLANLLWPDSPRRQARQNLRRALYNLRQILERPAVPPCLLVSYQDVRWNPACAMEVDVVTFTTLLEQSRTHAHPALRACPVCSGRLEQAVELYRGEFLAGQTLPDSAAFENWQLLMQEQLHEQVMAAMADLADYYERRREYGKASRLLRRQIGLEPWREETHRQLMRALALDGQRDAALKQFESCRQVLAQELDTPVSAETEALYEQIRSGELQPALAQAQPYKGLLPFTEDDAGSFFGRDAFTQRLVELVDQRPAVVVVGPSGSGKSSVVRAGLLPALRERGVSWLITSCRPGAQPFLRLAETLSGLLQSRGSAPALAGRLRRGELPLAELVAQILATHPPSVRLLLFIDQLEELYNLCADSTEASAFLNLLLLPLLAEDPPHQLQIVLALRADFSAQALSYRPLADAIQAGGLILGPMNQQELRQAIVAPAQCWGVTFQEGLVERLLQDVGEEPGNLPLLEFALTLMWQRRSSGQLTHAAYDEIGGVAGALSRHADQVYAQLGPGEQSRARRVLLRLVQPGEHTADTRRPATREELGEEQWALVCQLADARLVVTDRAPNGKEFAEIAHEALIVHWAQLRGWIDEVREELRLQRRLFALATSWDYAGREASFLLRGRQLEQFSAWAETTDLASGQVESAFLETSLAERERRQAEEQARKEREAALERRVRERQRRLNVVLAVASLIALTLAVFAFVQWRMARREAAISQSLNLASGARLALERGNTDQALALAWEANRTDDPPLQAQLTLSEAAYAPGTERLLLGHDGPVEDVAITPDGRAALSASADGTVIQWNLQTGQALNRFDGHNSPVHSVALLPDGARALSGAEDGQLLLWRVESGEVIRQLPGHQGTVHDIVVHPDGRRALSAAADGTLIVWDLETGAILHRLVGHEDAVLCAAISPDGTRALSGSRDRSVILWDLDSGEIVHQFAGQDRTVESIREPTGHVDQIWGVAFSPDGQQGISASQDQWVFRWDLAVGTLIGHYSSPEIGYTALALSPNGNTALLGTLDSRVAWFDLTQGTSTLQLLGHSGRILAVAFAPDGRHALSGASDGTLRLWDLRSGAEVRYLFDDWLGSGVDVSPQGDMGLACLWNGTIWVWDYATGAVVQQLVGHTEMVFAGASFTPDGQYVVSGSGDLYGVSEDNTVRLWDIATGQEIRRFEGHTANLWDVAVSPTGRYAASGSNDGTLRLWDLETGAGRILQDVSPQAVRSVAFSPDGQTILFGLAKGTSSMPDYSLRLMDVATGQEIRRFAGHSEAVAGVAISPDGRLAISGSLDQLAILWDVASGRIVHRLTDHASSLTGVSFSPDGRQAASSDMSGLVLLWDVESGALLRRFQGHASFVLEVVFGPDGQTVLSIAEDDTLREWRVDDSLEELLDWVGENRYVPELSCEQRAQYHVEPLCGE